ncbi:MAG: hypothetical protein ACD_12C00306G0001, partial [uncultured bacterium]
MAWNLSYIDFKKTITSAAVTPISFLVPYFWHKIFPISLAPLWKLTDLFFAGLSASFLTYVYWQTHKPKSILQKLAPLAILMTSMGFTYSFTSMSGEGIPIFFGLLGVYSIYKKNYFLAFFTLAICMLSKFTFYLIAPGLVAWGFLNLKNFNREEIRKITFYFLFFLLVFVSYHSFKNWVDIKLQFAYINSVIPTGIIYNFPYYFLALILGAPIITVFSILNPSLRNIFFLTALSALAMLLRRYFYWNHPQQVIMFLALYFFSSEKAKIFIIKGNILIQVAIFISIIMILPIYSKTIPLFFKHQTISESRQIEDEILKNYHGGKVGYYFNRAFDEPFPAYEISYMSEKQYDVW